MDISKTIRRLGIENLESRRLLAINPTADEQEVLQYINRFRTNPQGEFSRLFSSASPLTARNNSIQADLDFFKTSGTLLQSEWAALTPAKPITWNEAISSFSSTHNNSMASQNRLFHTDAVDRRNTLIAAGVNLDITSGERISSEIVFGQIRSPQHLYTAYAVNWGTGTGGMETNRSHRTALMNPVFEEIGGKITDTSASNLRPKVNTFVLANIKNAAVRVSGAVYEDRNGSTWYEAGEGLGGTTLSFEHSDGRKFSTTAFSAGGYQIDLPAGSYKLRVTGGGIQHAIVRTLTVADQSLWINFIYKATDPAPDANEPNDSTTFATTLAAPSSTIKNMSVHTGSDIDFYRYVPVGTGIAKYDLQFNNASGNIDLQLLNATGQVLASSTTTGNGESISFQADAGSTYFLRVFGAANPNYSITVTGPESIAPDSKEPNDSSTTATPLTGASPTQSAVSLHTNRDVDFYRYIALANGQATFDVQFVHASGNIDLQLLDVNGNVLATSSGTTNNESISRAVQRDTTYLVRVFGGPNRDYTLRITGPSLQPPVAVRDQTTVTSDSRTARLVVLNNDTDPDGNQADLIPSFVTPPPTGFSLNTDKSISYTAPAGFSGFVTASYLVTDKDGLRSSPANIVALAIDFARTTPWQNPSNAWDVNGDNRITAADALLVISLLNSRSTRSLPSSGSTTLFGFFDVNGDTRATATDALSIIGKLNSGRNGEGESFSGVTTRTNDLAIAQMMSGDVELETDSKKRRLR